MGSSLVLTGGAATAKTLKESISLTSHGFSVGDVLRWNNGSPSYVRAQADSAANAEVLGIVSANTDVNTFELTYAGYVDLPQFAGISYPVLFLSGVCAGGLTHNPPSAVGTVIKPVVTRHPTLNGYVMNNYLGTQIGGSSTIAVDEIQPVGTIMPFAGSAIPDTWLECNGSSYGISSYPELYDKIRYTSGDRMPIYGSVYELTVNSATDSAAAFNGAAVGDIVYINNRTSTATATTPTHTTHDFVGVILYKGILPSNSVWAGFIVQLLPKYDSTTKTFSYPNTAISVAANYVSGYFSKISVYANQSSTTAKFSNIALINDGLLTHFNTPDLRGRFAIGQNTTTLSEAETDSAYLSAITGNYPLGSEGGEERHTLTAGEMPSHGHAAGTLATSLSGSHQHLIYGQDNNALANGYSSNEVAQVQNPVDGGFTRLTGASGDHTHTITGSVGDTGGNISHNNMPPYLAVRYIIKAKPYTRAAIIDGVDLPYSNLLVRSTDSNSLRSELLSGVSGGDLVFYTNSGEASKRGTERMRIEVGGEVGIGTNAPSQKLHVYDGALRVDLLSGTNSAILAGPGSNLQIKHTSGNSNLTMYNSSGGGFIFSTFQSGTEGERIRITGDGSLGIGTATPGASLDVNGTLKVGNFGGATNVMAKPNMNAGSVGLVVPLVASAGDVNSDGVYYVTSALSEGTWLVFLQGFENAGSTNDADPVWVMFKVWTVPAGNYLVFSPNNDTLSATGNSGVSYRMNTSSMQTFTTANTNTVKSAPWVKLTAPTDVTIAGNYNPTGTQTGIVWNGRSRALLASGYAIRIA